MTDTIRKQSKEEELIEAAWGLIANAWDVADVVDGWKGAAERWREDWFEWMAR